MLTLTRVVEADGNSPLLGARMNDAEPHASVKRDGPGINWRGDAVHLCAAHCNHLVEERRIQQTPIPLAALRGRDANEVNVGDVRLRLRAKANEKGIEFT